MRLSDKAALVTVAASGIGKPIALTFAREGARVAIADVDTTVPASGRRWPVRWQSGSTGPATRCST